MGEGQRASPEALATGGTKAILEAFTMNIIALDIEIANVFNIDPGMDLDDYGPFDISVAATHPTAGEARLWLSRTAAGTPAPHLSQADAGALLQYLADAQQAGHAIVAWNGLSFDMRWIGHAAGNMQLASRVARRMYDPMFQFFKLKGFPIGLAKAGEGLGIKTKKLMDGADAPVHWRSGNHQLVCDYVLGDAKLTSEVAACIARAGEVRWITQRGKPSSARLGRLRTVEDCLRDPMPDQSWMNEPLEESRFSGWLVD